MSKKIHKLILCSLLLFGGLQAVKAQSGFADFRVLVKDVKDGRPVSGVLISLYKEGILVDSDTTDTDGRAQWATLQPGTYQVVATKGPWADTLENWPLNIGLNDEWKAQYSLIKTATIKVAKRPDPISLVGSTSSVSGASLLGSGRRGVDGLIARNSAILQTPQGISVRGTRADGNGTFIDGQRVIGGGGVGSLGTESVSAFIGGIPAQYGDLTGGAFSSTTRSATEKYVTAVEGITSSGLDPYSYNTLEGMFSGPLWIKKYKEDGQTRKLVKLGFVMDGTVAYYKDPSPTRTGIYVVDDNKLSEVERNPLVFTPNGFVSSASYLTEKDFKHLKARPNSPLATGNFWGKLEFRPTKYITVTGFANYFYSQGKAVSNNILNFNANPRTDATTLRSYLQFTQNFKVNKESNIKSAFYTIRADYQNSYSETRDAKHLDNIFDYGYIGTFTRYPMPVFQYSYYDQQQNPNRLPKTMVDQYGNTVTLRDYWEQVGYADTLMTFDRSELNKLRANYTQNVYDYYKSRGFKVTNQNTVLANQGLLNGYNPGVVYSLWSTPGTVTANWSKSQTERVALFAMGQMQVKPKTINGRERTPHDLQAGFFYEQQISRGYSIGANGLWILMNQLMNKHISELDMAHPILSYDANGVFTDTVRYNRLINWSEQSHFDRAFRNKLMEQGSTDVYGKKVDERTFVDINSYKPGDFSLDMFNADELLNNGNGFVSYFGYDHLGRTVRGKPSIESFLNDKDKRTIGAFQPVYIAAWLQDQFQFKDLVFRLGLRMERYDANQSVLKDPYSLYAIKTAAEVKTINGLEVLHPSNIGEDFKVYVNDITSPTKIVGYRDGDRWYNSDGSEQKSPEFLANQTSNGRIAPYLVDPTNQTLTKDALTDYTPAINLLPRIWFSFPLDPGKKTFYVSYDVLAQRPNSGASFLTIDELYYLKNRQGATISNGSLQSRVKTDYEVGYKQIFGRRRNRGLELAASYSEIRKDFGLYQINQGYPVTYITYRNIDFSTITGFRANMIFENIGKNDNGPLSIQASYMLQFADGTGSNINSQATLIASNQPNLRNVIPLGELDIRHNIKASATWQWAGGRDPKTRKNLYTGPIVGGKEILKFTSLSIIGNGYSGTPYTPTTQPVQIGAVQRAQIKGVPYGARLPWQYTLDLNLTKGFSLRREGKENPLVFYAFVWVQNVLNTKNIISVFPYTGQPQDDGFLTSPNGQQVIQSQVNAQSYTDLYRVLLNSQTGNYGSPRQIRAGLRVNFN
ncbi:MAG: hypothetical protein KG003_10640 [Bacteroidetes bacterium]|nr:hypothetical protein [Bacteroidota bacterium]